jgi:hypothetical protein
MVTSTPATGRMAYQFLVKSTCWIISAISPLRSDGAVNKKPRYKFVEIGLPPREKRKRLFVSFGRGISDNM